MLATLTETVESFTHSPLLHSIGGKSVPSSDGSVQDVFDPSTGDKIASVAIGANPEVEMAFAAAQAAFPAWAAKSPVERAVILHRLADAMEKHSKDLIQIESLDVGKAIVNSEGFDIPFGVACVRYFADLVQQVPMDTPLALPNIEARRHRSPYGVCGFIFPWNFPYDLLMWNIVPALAAGEYSGRQTLVAHSAQHPLCGSAGQGGRLPRRRHQCCRRWRCCGPRHLQPPGPQAD